MNWKRLSVVCFAFLIAAAAALLMVRLANKPQVTVKPVTLTCNGFKLAGDLYVPARTGCDKAVLVLHGSTPQGRNLILYREFSRRLCLQGFVVCNLDQRGHGDSQGPAVVRQIEDLDFVSDARQAARALLALARPAGIESIAMAGHSFGGGVAVVAGLAESTVSRVVAIGPGRRISERYFGPDSEEGLTYVQKRKSIDMKLAEPIPVGLIKPMLAAYNIEQIRGTTPAKPLLVVEGQREDPRDLSFTTDLLATVTGPAEHIVITNADHYFGTREIEKQGVDEWEVTRPEVLDDLAASVAAWLKRR